MPTDDHYDLRSATQCAVFVSFVWQGHVGFSLWDEGFLWYGVQSVMVGEVPIRDFMSYDPGRYYWCAAIMAAWGDNGIMALRAAVAIFQATGLFIGLSLVAKHAKWKDLIYCLLVAVMLAAWMFPRHKLFDISLSMMLLGVLTHLVMNPHGRSYFFAGQREILAVFHYLPLHLSPMGRHFGGCEGDCPITEKIADRLLRLPFYTGMTDLEQTQVIDAVCAFRC